MKELTKIQSIALALGALLMVASTGLVVFNIIPQVSAVIFAIGAITFAAMQMMQTYSGDSLTIRRLRRIMVAGDICFILSALLMLEHVYHFAFPYFATTIEGYNAYVHYIYNNWVIPLLIGAVIELYTTHRIAYEIKKGFTR